MPAITPTKFTGFGFNYLCRPGPGGILNPAIRALVDQDLAELKSMGVTRIRTGCPPYTFTGTPTTEYPIQGLALSRLFAKYVHDAGFKVLHGVTAISSTNVEYNSTQWTNYRDGYTDGGGMARGVIAEAIWAQANGIDEFTTGNEEGLHVSYTNGDAAIDADNVTYPDAPSKAAAKSTLRATTRQNIRADQRNLAAAAKAVFTNGPVCVSISEGEQTNGTGGGWMTDYATLSTGGYDRLDCNMYDSVANFRSHIVRNLTYIPTSKIGITELNLDDGYNNIFTLNSAFDNIGKEEERWARDQQQRLQLVKDLGIPSVFYFSLNQFPFTYALRNDGTNNYRMAFDGIMATANGIKPRHSL